MVIGRKGNYKKNILSTIFFLLVFMFFGIHET